MHFRIFNFEKWKHIFFLLQNAIERIENLECMTSLQFLTLAGNKIRKVENLMILDTLKLLDLSDNRIADIDAGKYDVKLYVVSWAEIPPQTTHCFSRTRPLTLFFPSSIFFGLTFPTWGRGILVHHLSDKQNKKFEVLFRDPKIMEGGGGGGGGHFISCPTPSKSWSPSPRDFRPCVRQCWFRGLDSQSSGSGLHSQSQLVLLSFGKAIFHIAALYPRAICKQLGKECSQESRKLCTLQVQLWIVSNNKVDNGNE